VAVHRGAQPSVTAASGDDGVTVRVHRSGVALASAQGVTVHRGAPPEADAPVAEAPAGPAPGEAVVAVR